MTAVAGRVRGLPGRRTFWQRASPHMLILLKADATPEQQEAVEQHIRSLGYVPTSSRAPPAPPSASPATRGPSTPSRSG